ncbi:MAG: DNA polymerase IV [Candidatus Sungbacteria bacterium]|nr:DNA polymerase IV [Candidatus Sungbacteria bacterium]
MNRIIGHLDMDAFFAAVEERDHEWLRGLPVVVGADPQNGWGRGVVSTANYKAREYGIRSALPISQAWRFSEEAKKRGRPAAIFLGPNFERYEETSLRIISLIRANKRIVEEASIDEAYFDLSHLNSYERAIKLCKDLKAEIFEKEKLTCSIGIGPNKLIAKIASDMQKPDGLTVVEEKDAEAFLEPLSIRKIPGVGPKTELLFRNRGINVVKDLKRFSCQELEDISGKWGRELYEKIRGHDDTPLEEDHEIKSIGEQETFSEDTLGPNFILERLSEICRRVLARMVQDEFAAFRTAVVTVRFADFETKSRSRTLVQPARTFEALRFEALKLLMPFLDHRENPRGKRIRLIGVRVEKLV